MAILVTGAAGFIGSNLVRSLLDQWPERTIVSLDSLTYAGHLANLRDVLGHDRHVFVEGDVADADLVRSVFDRHEIVGVIHLAAESHVDRSILGPTAFVRTNVEGTVVLLQMATEAWDGRDDVRFQEIMRSQQAVYEERLQKYGDF